MSRPITPTQMAVIEHCRTHGGNLYRWPYGRWCLEGDSGQPQPGWWTSTLTVKRLIEKKIMRKAFGFPGIVELL